MLLAALAVGHHPRAAAVGPDFPDVELVVQEDRLVALRPSRDAERRWRIRRVVALVEELHGQRGREVDARSIRHLVAEPVARLLVEVHHVVPAGRERRGRAPVLEDLLARAGFHIDEVDVVVRLVPRDLLLIRHVGRAERAHRIVAGVHVRKIGGRQLQEALVGKVHDRAVVARAVLVGAHLLHRLDLRILVAPEIDARRRGRVLLARRFRRRRGAEIQPRVVLAEPRREVVAHDVPRRHALRRRGHELGSRGVASLPVVEPVR